MLYFLGVPVSTHSTFRYFFLSYLLYFFLFLLFYFLSFFLALSFFLSLSLPLLPLFPPIVTKHQFMCLRKKNGDATLLILAALLCMFVTVSLCTFCYCSSLERCIAILSILAAPLCMLIRVYLSPFCGRSASQHGYLANCGSFIVCVWMGICVLFTVAFFGNSLIYRFTDFIRTLFVHQWAME